MKASDVAAIVKLLAKGSDRDELVRALSDSDAPANDEIDEAAIRELARADADQMRRARRK